MISESIFSLWFFVSFGKRSRDWSESGLWLRLSEIDFVFSILLCLVLVIYCLYLIFFNLIRKEEPEVNMQKLDPPMITSHE